MPRRLTGYLAAVRLGWAVSSNWTRPILFITYSVLRPISVALILAGFTQLGGYIAAIWLLCIAVNLLTSGRYFDIAVRDIALAVSAFTLARLTEAGVGVTEATAASLGGRTVTA